MPFERSKNRDPERKDWVGTEVGYDRMILALGDDRDKFSEAFRLRNFRDNWRRFNHLWAPDRSGPKLKLGSHQSWAFDMRLIAGEMGARKTLLAGHLMRRDFAMGHPAFSTGNSILFGNQINGPEIYHTVERMPMYANAFFDEAHAIAPSTGSNITGVSLLDEITAGLRKKGAKMTLASAKPAQIARRILEQVRTIYIPQKITAQPSAGNEYLFDLWDKGPWCNDPRNFQIVWYVFEDFPVMQPNHPKGYLLGGRINIGKPRRVFWTKDPYAVRISMTLTDSFDPVEPGLAREFGTAAQLDAYKKQEADFEGLESAEIHRDSFAGKIFFLERQGLEYINKRAMAVEMGLDGKTFSELLDLTLIDQKGLVNSRTGLHVPRIKEYLETKYGYEVQE